jgi:hypothetical protein
MTQTSSSLSAIISENKAVNHYTAVGSLIRRILQNISKMELPGTGGGDSGGGLGGGTRGGGLGGGGLGVRLVY